MSALRASGLDELTETFTACRRREIARLALGTSVAPILHYASNGVFELIKTLWPNGLSQEEFMRRSAAGRPPEAELSRRLRAGELSAEMIDHLRNAAVAAACNFFRRKTEFSKTGLPFDDYRPGRREQRAAHRLVQTMTKR